MCSDKLVLDYYPKKEYVIHCLTLKCYLKLGGFNIENIQYIIRFRQSKYMKEYIELNHKLLCLCNNENDRKMFKLVNNSLCGGALLNKEKFNSNIKIISDVDKAQKAASKDTFKAYDIIDTDNVLINIEKRFIRLDSPCYIGSCILDFSRILIYNYYYTLNNMYK